MSILHEQRMPHGGLTLKEIKAETPQRPRLPTPSTSTRQPSIGSQLQRLNKLGCGYLVPTLC